MTALALVVNRSYSRSQKVARIGARSRCNGVPPADDGDLRPPAVGSTLSGMPDEPLWLPQAVPPGSVNYVMAAPPVQIAVAGVMLLELRPDGTIFVRGQPGTDAEIVAALREYMVAFRDRYASPPPTVCARCKGTGIIETGNNDMPCECPAGDEALFNTVDGLKTGKEIRTR